MNRSNQRKPETGAELIVQNLVAHDVTHVFGIPGAKVDRLFDALADSPIETVVTRHEQNAVFIAGAIGRLTGRAGVAIATSGPGVSNFVTGLATANSEGDPLLAIGGAVKLGDRLKLAHQSLDTVSLCAPVTKFSAEITAASAVSETVANALRVAEGGRPGSAFISVPMDILNAPAVGGILADKPTPSLGLAAASALESAQALIRRAKRPVILLGMMASKPDVAEAVRRLIAVTQAATVGTYQAAGAVSDDLAGRFGGRVGLFRNQPGDRLLHNADVIISIGYNPIEYDPELWNVDDCRDIVHIDIVPAEIDNSYAPAIELIGDIASNVEALAGRLGRLPASEELESILRQFSKDRRCALQNAKSEPGHALHPLEIVREIDDVLSSDISLCLDMGSFHIWLARYMLSFRARQMLISNGQQTMGVALPWAIAASLVRPHEKVVSVSGDGGFMMSSMELETAVRLNCNIVHIIWVDHAYNMVEMQEKAKYGRESGTRFGPIDFAAYARACGAKGIAVQTVDGLRSALRSAMETEGPVVISVPVDYAHNRQLILPLPSLGQVATAA